MIILGIETSCDETALALIEVSEAGKGSAALTVLANEVLSQAALHKKYGGVFPTLAKREHAKNLVPLLKTMLETTWRASVPAEASHGQRPNRARESARYSDVLENIRIEFGRDEGLKNALVGFLKEAERPPIDLIAVTAGPGLEPCLWTGLNFAKTLSAAWSIQLVAVNHMEGHILVSLLKQDQSAPSSQRYLVSQPEFPAIALLISGGHTELVLMKNEGEYEIVGRTRDDAVGEAFDKVARILGLPYPGGPEISRLADSARTQIHGDINADTRGLNHSLYTSSSSASISIPNPRQSASLKLPRPMLHSDNLDFSFSGLKTAVLYLVKKLEQEAEKGHPRESASSISENPRLQMEIAQEFEDAVTDVLVEKVRKAVELYGVKTLTLGGGVVANKNIRSAFEKLASELGIVLNLPAVNHATDNALMIALAGYFHRTDAVREIAELAGLEARGNLSFPLAA